MLERRGIISGYEGSKPRQVLVTEADVPRVLAALSERGRGRRPARAGRRRLRPPLGRVRGRRRRRPSVGRAHELGERSRSARARLALGGGRPRVASPAALAASRSASARSRSQVDGLRETNLRNVDGRRPSMRSIGRTAGLREGKDAGTPWAATRSGMTPVRRGPAGRGRGTRSDAIAGSVPRVASERAAIPSAAVRLEADRQLWLEQLTGSGHARDEAVARLHALLARRRAVRGLPAAGPRCRHLRGRRLGRPGPAERRRRARRGARQAATTSAASSRFTTWAYKFALYEAAVKPPPPRAGRTGSSRCEPDRWPADRARAWRPRPSTAAEKRAAHRPCSARSAPR